MNIFSKKDKEILEEGYQEEKKSSLFVKLNDYDNLKENYDCQLREGAIKQAKIESLSRKLKVKEKQIEKLKQRLAEARKIIREACNDSKTSG